MAKKKNNIMKSDVKILLWDAILLLFSCSLNKVILDMIVNVVTDFMR
jgi:hypothetical protein